MEPHNMTKRIYFTATLIFLLLFFMFQIPNIIRNDYNNYSYNPYDNASLDENISSNSLFTSKMDFLDIYNDSHNYVIFLGKLDDNTIGTTVKQWCTFSKRNVLSIQNLSELTINNNKKPECLLIDSAYFKAETDTKILENISESGINIIFCSMPNYNIIQSNNELMNFLGISSCEQSDLSVYGFKLYENFLIGGETWFIPQNENDKNYQDFDETISYYKLSNKTKIYMSASTDSNGNYNPVKEDLPPVIWRKSSDNAYVFCINGNYLNDSKAMGLLYGFTYESKNIDVYPVINANADVIINYPMFSMEYDEKFNELYSKNMISVLENVIWPDLYNLSETTGIKYSFMISPQYNYDDEITPDLNVTEYFFRLFKEKDFEAGLSTYHVNNITLNSKLKSDKKIFTNVVNNYNFYSMYLNKDEISVIEHSKEYLAKNINYFVTDKNESTDNLLFTYTDDHNINIRTLLNGNQFSYKNEFFCKSLETSLGYTVSGTNFTDICCPKDDSILWNRFYENISSAHCTYANSRKKFNKCSISETGKRIQNFLQTDYECKNNTNEIDLTINNTDCYFILRTHLKVIDTISGANYEKIEDGSYLLKPTEKNIHISFKSN